MIAHGTQKNFGNKPMVHILKVEKDFTVRSAPDIEANQVGTLPATAQGCAESEGCKDMVDGHAAAAEVRAHSNASTLSKTSSGKSGEVPVDKDEECAHHPDKIGN